ncbi:MAG: DUF362 domain-containing protein [Acidobacteriia bacterium]|nr:DUF362 domain-containing protein [Terriglobia bacterium]
MPKPSRRDLFRASLAGIGGLRLRGADAEKARVGFVASSHSKLARPSPAEDALDYPRVREMVWRAIEYGRPRAGSLEAKIRPGSWVVIKPNIIGLPPRRTYRTGDVTDLRVTKAVLEYVAAKSRAARITVAEGGSYRRIGDPAPDNRMTQNGVQVDALTADWGGEFAGLNGSLGDVLQEARERFPGKRFDYIDLAYDPARDESGQFQWMEVPRSPNGAGAFGEKPVYVMARTVLDCDFLISVPVMKCHTMCGVTGCLKNYVGTAPRIVYTTPGSFSNNELHSKHSLEGRIDSFIVDLAAFHPPDYSVVDAIRGLQYNEHRIDRPDQEMRSNLVMAGEDPVAIDTLAASIMGFQPHDIEYLHMASQRQMGTMDLRRVEVTGDEPDRFRRAWGKPNNWYGRCNRTWLVTQDPQAEMKGWERHTTVSDTLHCTRWRPPASDDAVYRAAARVVSEGARKAFLWVGARGRITAFLNGEKVMEEEGLTRYRVGQFQKAVELRPGENLLVFELKPAGGTGDLSALLVGPRNDGDTVEGIRWSA